MKKLRVLVLMHESLVPPDTLAGYTPQQIEEWKTEYDVMAFLREAGHEVRALGLYDNLAELRTEIATWKPDVAFNLLQEFQGIVTYDQHIVAFLELMRQPYTGCNPRGMMLSRDKVLSKQLMAYHRIPTPQFALFRRERPYRLCACVSASTSFTRARRQTHWWRNTSRDASCTWACVATNVCVLFRSGR